MDITGKGALPDFLIKEMMDCRLIKYADESCINPASLDLTITNEVLRLESLVLPRMGERVTQTLLFD